jgi:hypothetical protein
MHLFIIIIIVNEGLEDMIENKPFWDKAHKNG